VIALPMASPYTGFGGDDPAAIDVRTRGAKGDSKTKDTSRIQAAIDECARKGGGTVSFPAGTFLSGSLHLASNVRLHLDSGATLLASKDATDFDPYESLTFKNAADRETSYFHHALIWGEDLEHIAITGTGKIHGNRTQRGGPKPIALKRCKHVSIRDVTITDSPNYCISLLGTDYVTIDGVTILNGFSDGIDPDCCHHVRIANCHIESWDDAIVAKTSFSLGKRRSTENLSVTNCTLATNCNAFKLGTESGGDFRNITVSNCTMLARKQGRPPISGISLLSVDGATIEGVAISNVAMTDVCCPVFLRLGNRGRDLATPEPGAVRRIVVAGIVATGSRWPCTIAGVPARPIEGVTFSDFHAGGIHLSSIHLTCEAADERPALVCDDVHPLTIDSFEARKTGDRGAVMEFHDVEEALVRGCMPNEGTQLFLRVGGGRSKRISLLSNDLSGIGRAVELAEGAPPHCVTTDRQ
jgi:hypothetical protein